MIGIAYNLHDHNTFDGRLHKQYERYSRFKYNMNGIDNSLLNEFANEKHEGLKCISTTRGFIRDVENNPFGKYKDEILSYEPRDLTDHLRLDDDTYYIDHHQSHAIYAFLTSGFTKSDILAIDGVGLDNRRCFFNTSDGKWIDLSDECPIGLLWNVACNAAGISSRNAGKLMGLSAYGQVDEKLYNALLIVADEARERDGVGYFNRHDYDPKDIAATVQQLTMDMVEQTILPYKTCDNICIAGGVAYNGYMNEWFTKHYKKVHVPPAPGDEGQAIGNYMHADYVLNNTISIPSAYSGQSYDWNHESAVDLDLDFIADKISKGSIVGWFQGKSESGNRALGNRSILADPRNKNIKDIINSQIKLREDYRPFAPSVLIDRYQEFFDTNQPSPYMSRIMPVISDKIPGVTHVDGTARIQTVSKTQNERYYNLITAFESKTDIPMLVNTSFNCQEPIVETPEDALRTFTKTGLDILVINDRMILK